MTNEQQAVYVSALEAQLDRIIESLESRLLDVLPDSEIETTTSKSFTPPFEPVEYRSVPLLRPLWDFSELLHKHRQMLSVGRQPDENEV